MTLKRSVVIALVAALPAAALVSGCGPDDTPYTPRPAHSGQAVQLPDVPTLTSRPVKIGDAYSVWGATHHLRSIVHSRDVKDKDLSIMGYIVKTNFGDAPVCAVHPTGKADPDDCKPPVPAFWIADDPTNTKDAIKVMGFASNFAQLYDAIKGADSERTIQDEFLGTPLPKPLPNVGAKVKVTGTYGYAYTRATSGIETDPLHGILTYQKIEYVEPPKEVPKLPGMK